MKKLLLTLVCAVVALCASAATNVTLADLTTVPGENKVGGFTITIDKGIGQSKPQIYGNGEEQALRTYANNTITFTGKKLTKIVFTINATSAKRYADLTPSTGKINPAQATGDTQVIWEGDASNVTFTVGEKAVYGTESTKAGQVHISAISIEGEGGEATVEPTPETSYVIEATSLTVPGSSNVKGFTFNIEKGEGGNAPLLHNNTKAVRMYAKNTITVSAKNLKSITFNLATDAQFRYTTVTPSTGEITPAQAAGDTKFTWVGDAESVTFTVGEKATLGTDGEDKAGQLRVSSFTIEGTPGEGGGTVDPQPSEAGTEANPINVAKAIELASALDENGSIENAYVRGKIKEIKEVSTNFGNATFYISDEGSENSFYIFRAKWLNNENFTAENQIAVGATVTLTGKLMNYKGNSPQLGNGYVVKYDGNGGDTPEPETKSFKTIAEYLAAAYTEGKSTLDCPLTCVYQNGRYLYLTDGTSPMLVYGDLKTDTNADGVIDANDESIKYTNGDIIPAGITGKYTVYNNLKQLGSPVADTFGAATKGNAVAPKAIKANEINAELMNTYIVMNGVTIEGADRNFTVTDATGSVALFNQFNDPTYYDAVTVETGENITLEAIITVYKENVQLYPVKVSKSGSAVEDITVDANAPVEFYNLQGIRVANPENGIFIRRQGSNATKIIIR